MYVIQLVAQLIAGQSHVKIPRTIVLDHVMCMERRVHVKESLQPAKQFMLQYAAAIVKLMTLNVVQTQRV